MTLRRTVPMLVCLGLLALAFAPAAGAATGAAGVPQAGPLDEGFLQALHDPMITTGLGHMPNPVGVSVDAAASANEEADDATLPAAFSLVAEGRVSAVRDQGGYSTCWAFANIGAVESKLLPQQAWDLSEDNLIGRSGFGSSMEWRYNWGGYDFMAVAYLARWAGPVSETNDRYPTWRLPRVNRVRKHVQGVVMIPGRTDALDNDLVKQLVMDNGALSVGMYWTDDAYNDYGQDDPDAQPAYYLASERGENHGVDIVGWDDTFSRQYFTGGATKPPGDGAFLVRNSWGSGWGKEGYFWVSYFDASFAREQQLGTNGGCTSYSSVSGTGNYARNYQYDKLGVTDHWGYPNASDPSRVWGANRFTAAATETIAAAGFYTLAADSAYEVWAGRSLGSLRLRASGVIALPGYTTVDLTAPLRVQRGRRFVVSIKLTSPGEGYPLAIERPARSWQSGARASLGQSYMSYDGSSWTDLNRRAANANVCLKAFAR